MEVLQTLRRNFDRTQAVGHMIVLPPSLLQHLRKAASWNKLTNSARLVHQVYPPVAQKDSTLENQRKARSSHVIYAE